jgi:hypothetical protein
MFIITPNYKQPNGVETTLWRVGNIIIDSLSDKLTIEVLGYMDAPHYMINKVNGVLERRSICVNASWESIMNSLEKVTDLEEIVFAIGLKRFTEIPTLLMRSPTEVVDQDVLSKYSSLFSV